MLLFFSSYQHPVNSIDMWSVCYVHSPDDTFNDMSGDMCDELCSDNWDIFLHVEWIEKCDVGMLHRFLFCSFFVCFCLAQVCCCVSFCFLFFWRCREELYATRKEEDCVVLLAGWGVDVWWVEAWGLGEAGRTFCG